jgi:hypothetical protein
VKSSDRRMERERVEATLAAVDAALASGRAASHDERERELGQLALTLHAGAPEPPASFAAELDARVAAGFAPNGDMSSAGRRPSWTDRMRAPARTRTAAAGGAPGPRIGRPALGVLAAVLLVVIGSGTLLAGLGQLGPDQSLRGTSQDAAERPGSAVEGTAGDEAGRSVAPSAPMTTAP